MTYRTGYNGTADHSAFQPIRDSLSSETAPWASSYKHDAGSKFAHGSPTSVGDWASFEQGDQHHADPQQQTCAPPQQRRCQPTTEQKTSTTWVKAAASDNISMHATAQPSAGRPKLQLLPRSKPLPGSDSAAQSTDDSSKPKPSIFGSARPREEVLRERGVDPTIDPPRTDVARSASDNSRRPVPPSARSGMPEDGPTEWQVVSGGRPRAAGIVDAAAPRAPRNFYDTGYEAGMYRSYGSAGSGADNDVDDDDMFRRGLPMRQADLF